MIIVSPEGEAAIRVLLACCTLGATVMACDHVGVNGDSVLGGIQRPWARK